MLTTSSRIVVEAAIKKLKAYYDDAEMVTRAQILQYLEATGEKMPIRFWDATKVARGVHSLDITRLGSVAAEVEVDETDEDVPSGTMSRFVRELMIPKVDDDYVNGAISKIWRL